MLEDIFAQLTSFLVEAGWTGLVLTALAGLAIALTGYRIRLIFFFVVGFYVSAAIVGPLFAAIIEVPQSSIIFGAIAGLVGGLLAVRLYFVALFLVGLLAGASLLVALSTTVFGQAQLPLLVATAIGAVVGGVAALALDRVAVIAGSAWVGALHAAAAGSTILYRTIAMSEAAWYAIFTGLVIVITLTGMLYQLRAFPTSRYRYDRRKRRPGSRTRQW